MGHTRGKATARLEQLPPHAPPVFLFLKHTHAYACTHLKLSTAACRAAWLWSAWIESTCTPSYISSLQGAQTKGRRMRAVDAAPTLRAAQHRTPGRGALPRLAARAGLAACRPACFSNPQRALPARTCEAPWPCPSWQQRQAPAASAPRQSAAAAPAACPLPAPQTAGAAARRRQLQQGRHKGGTEGDEACEAGAGAESRGLQQQLLRRASHARICDVLYCALPPNDDPPPTPPPPPPSARRRALTRLCCAPPR